MTSRPHKEHRAAGGPNGHTPRPGLNGLHRPARAVPPTPASRLSWPGRPAAPRAAAARTVRAGERTGRPTWPMAGAIQPAVVYGFAEPVCLMGSHAATIRFSIGPEDAGDPTADPAQAPDRLPRAGTAGLHAGAGGAP